MTFPQIYRDRDDLYLEFPTYVLRFAFTAGGLAKALQHIPDVSPPVARGRVESINKVIPKLARSTKTSRERKPVSPSERSAASAVIRAMRPKQ